MPPATPRDYTRLLDHILDVGAELVTRLRDDPVRPGQDVARDYDLVTRSIRRSILLVRKLAEDPEPARAAQRGKHRAQARKRILREVEDAIQRRAAEPDASNLRAELLERLDAPELDDDIDTRPIPDIIADIVHDLGAVSPLDRPRWQRRSPGDVQYLCTLANRAAGQPRPPEPAAQGPLYRDAPLAEHDALEDEPDDTADPVAALATVLRHESLTRDRR